MKHYDAVIIGAGVVGATLALALGQLKYQVLLIEKADCLQKPTAFEARTFALSFSSQFIYASLGLWPALALQAVPIEQVAVSVAGQFGSCHLRANEIDQKALGFVVSAYALQHALYEALSTQETVQILKPATLAHSFNTPTQWEIEVETLGQRHTLTSKLLVGAYGTASPLTTQQSILYDKKEYDHYAIVSNLQRTSFTPFVAIERFLKEGAIALLPWQENYTTCVWTTTASKAQELNKMDDKDFLKACQIHLGKRIGKLQAVSQRHCFPLQMQVAQQQHGARFLLMGNAAHSLHPIAAQGLNLSLRDIGQFRNQLTTANQCCDLGSPAFLQMYVNSRRGDQNRVIFATDKIARFMSGNSVPSVFRAGGITLLDCITPLKNRFTRFSMGLV